MTPAAHVLITDERTDVIDTALTTAGPRMFTGSEMTPTTSALILAAELSLTIVRAEVIVLNPAKDPRFEGLAELGARVVTTAIDTVEVLAELASLLPLRSAEIRGRGGHCWQQLHPSMRPAPVVLAIDEWDRLTMSPAAIALGIDATLTTLRQDGGDLGLFLIAADPSLGAW